MEVTNNKDKILIIEDTVGYQRVYHDALEAEGYKVISADNGKQGWELTLKDRPNLILLDLILPEMHGFEVLNKVRTHPDTKAIPVIILSVLGEAKNGKKAIELGANDYAVKGKITPKGVIEKMRKLLAEVHENTEEENRKISAEKHSFVSDTNFGRFLTCPYCRAEMVLDSMSSSGPSFVCPRCDVMI
ncbi:MAG: response regulator [Planctomycetes bacterium]|nr:response regulator [Planctomycetota bacterium]